MCLHPLAFSPGSWISPFPHIPPPPFKYTAGRVCARLLFPFRMRASRGIAHTCLQGPDALRIVPARLTAGTRQHLPCALQHTDTTSLLSWLPLSLSLSLLPSPVSDQHLPFPFPLLTPLCRQVESCAPSPVHPHTSPALHGPGPTLPECHALGDGVLLCAARGRGGQGRGHLRRSHLLPRSPGPRGRGGRPVPQPPGRGAPASLVG
jgi:hypothetical protein